MHVDANVSWTCMWRAPTLMHVMFEACQRSVYTKCHIKDVHTLNNKEVHTLNNVK